MPPSFVISFTRQWIFLYDILVFVQKILLISCFCKMLGSFFCFGYLDTVSSEVFFLFFVSGIMLFCFLVLVCLCHLCWYCYMFWLNIFGCNISHCREHVVVFIAFFVYNHQPYMNCQNCNHVQVIIPHFLLFWKKLLKLLHSENWL